MALVREVSLLLHQYTFLEPTILLPPYYLLAYPNLSRTLEVVFGVFFCMIIHGFVCFYIIAHA